MDVTNLIVLGISAVCGLWWLSFPNSIVRVYQALFGSRFSPRPSFIRLAGGVWLAVSLWMVWTFCMGSIPK